MCPVILPTLAIAWFLSGCAGGGAGANALQQIPCRDTLRGCPDLKVSTSMLTPVRFETLTFAPNACAVVEGLVPSGGTFKLLRFTTGFPNIGQGDLIVGSPVHPANAPYFEYSPCHQHYHFHSFSAYRLWTLSGYAAWQALRASAPNVLPRVLLGANPQVAAQMVGGSKRAFCIEDVQRYGGYSGPLRPQQFDDCSVSQGITVGWMDVYSWQIEGNWIEITDVPAGTYVLEVEVNPEQIIQEEDYTNNASSAQVQIP